MPEIIFAIFMTSCVCGIIFSFWVLRCNKKTYSDRSKLIDVVFAQANWLLLNHAMDRVTYEQHMWRYAFFGDPWGLYAPALRELVSKLNETMTEPTSQQVQR